MSTPIEDLYHRLGYPGARELGQGMEGRVHRLGRGRAGKVWWSRTAGELRALAAFHQELVAQDLPWDRASWTCTAGATTW